MRALVANAERGQLFSSGLVLLSLVILAAAEVHTPSLRLALPLAAGLIVVAVAHSALLRWQNMVAGIVLVILFIPIRKYSLPGHLPFSLEPYRILVAVVALAWVTSLLVDRRVRIRRTGFEAPVGLVLAGILLSDLANPSRASTLETEVVKKLSFWASFVILLYLIRSLVRTQRDLDFVLKVLVGGGAIVSAFAVVESRTGFNVFNHLHTIFPLLRFDGLAWSDLHGYTGRAFGSAEHPIAMGAGLVLIAPLAVYLVKRTGQHRWRLALFLLLAGSLATRSRTGVVMLLVVLIVFCLLRWSEMKKLWPMIIPFILVAHIAMPGMYGELWSKFHPKGGLIAQQKAGAGGYGSGRIADLGPGVHEWAHHPFFGDGFGTRITAQGESVPPNAPILDDQWLGTLLETGIVGFISWIWLFAHFIRRMGGRARSDPSPRGWLMTGLTASIAAYAIGMCFYDAFSFSQEVFLLFILLAIASVALALESPHRSRARQSSAARVSARAQPAPQG